MSQNTSPPKSLAASTISTPDELRQLLAKQYLKTIQNFFGEQKRALRFMSAVMAAVQRNPKLLECTTESIVNSFLMMAQLEFMPSDVSGEAYVLPYMNSKLVNGKWTKIHEAQFQLGYQGLVTLFYRAGIREIQAEIVYEGDKFSVRNGEITHEPDPFSDDRGKPRGAYAIVHLSSGGKVSKTMSAKEILEHGKRFSRSFRSDESPWHQTNDPQLWMWRKTVLRQLAKLVPKEAAGFLAKEAIIKALDADNGDSVLGEERLNLALKAGEKLKMKNLTPSSNSLIHDKSDDGSNKAEKEGQNNQGADPVESAEGLETDGSRNSGGREQ